MCIGFGPRAIRRPHGYRVLPEVATSAFSHNKCCFRVRASQILQGLWLKFKLEPCPGWGKMQVEYKVIDESCGASTTRAIFKQGAGQEDPRGTFLYYVCITLVLREQVSSQEPAGGSQGYFLYYVCITLVLRKQVSSQEPAGGVPGVLVCITFVLRFYYESKLQARSPPGGSQGYFFVLRLYYACTTGANLKPGAGPEEPRGTLLYYVCTTLVLRDQI